MFERENLKTSFILHMYMEKMKFGKNEIWENECSLSIFALYI